MIQKIKTLAKDKILELYCKRYHQSFDRETVGKFNLNQLEFEFDKMCITCKPIRWIGKRPKVVREGISTDG